MRWAAKLRTVLIPAWWLLWIIAVVTALLSQAFYILIFLPSEWAGFLVDYGLGDMVTWLETTAGGQALLLLAYAVTLGGVAWLLVRLLRRTSWNRRLLSNGLRVLAVVSLAGGLLLALFNYELAFGSGTLNQFHALRGLTYNIGAYTFARLLLWIAAWLREA